MKLWMSGEIQSDVADEYRKTRQKVEAAVNERLLRTKLSTEYEEWAFIAIVRRESHPDYGEVKRRHRRTKAVEFRLWISHRDFLTSSEPQRFDLILAALRRCVAMMEDLGIVGDDRQRLADVLEEVQAEGVESS